MCFWELCGFSFSKLHTDECWVKRNKIDIQYYDWLRNHAKRSGSWGEFMIVINCIMLFSCVNPGDVALAHYVLQKYIPQKIPCHMVSESLWQMHLRYSLPGGNLFMIYSQIKQQSRIFKIIYLVLPIWLSSNFWCHWEIPFGKSECKMCKITYFARKIGGF